MTSKKQDARSARHGETAAHYLVAAVPRAQVEQTVGEALAALVDRRYDCADCLCVVDGDDRLVGVLPLPRLLGAPRERRLADEIQHRCPHVLPDVDQERVASVALHHGISAVPVVDRSGRLLGVVPSVALLHILRREHVEDIHRLSGIARETHQAREALESPPLRRARHRLPWLLVGLAGSMLATLLVAGFQGVMASNLAVAFFVPGLVYLADAIGTQSEAVAVRGLSLSHTGLGQLIGGEMRTGLLMGSILAAIALPTAWLAFGNARLALAVALALVCAGAVATTIGLLLPWLLGKLGSDPAYGSGPLATIAQDLLTLLIYFATVQMIAI
jgi:magnesium transporter